MDYGVRRSRQGATLPNAREVLQLTLYQERGDWRLRSVERQFASPFRAAQGVRFRVFSGCDVRGLFRGLGGLD